jgi:anti-sigma regulatory factor (Ser/Thr protein kinase)
VSVERSFPGAPDSVPMARHFVLDALSDLPGPASDVLGLMVSEVVTNCVLHAASSFHVAVQRSGSTIRVEVNDSGGGHAQIQSPDASDTHGRGLLIVQALSDEWGVTTAATHTGKTVWFSLSVAMTDDTTTRRTTTDHAVTPKAAPSAYRYHTRLRDEQSSERDESKHVLRSWAQIRKGVACGAQIPRPACVCGARA